MNENKTFGELLREYRNAQGLSQQELAEKADIYRRPTISEYENGISFPNRAAFQDLVKPLNLSKPEEAQLWEKILQGRRKKRQEEEAERKREQEEAERKSQEEEAEKKKQPPWVLSRHVIVLLLILVLSGAAVVLQLLRSTSTSSATNTPQAPMPTVAPAAVLRSTSTSLIRGIYTLNYSVF